MSIYDQGYQHWEGTFRPHSIRWLVIAEHGIRGALRTKMPRRLIFLTLLPSSILIAILSIWGLVEQDTSWATAFEPFLGMFGLAEIAMNGPKAHRLTVWTFAFDIFLQAQVFFALLALLVVGPRLISQDLRANALPLYLSRPLNRWDYFLGKFAVVAVSVGSVTIFPLTIAYICGLAFSFDLTVIRDTIGLFGGAIVYCLVLTCSAGLLVLAFSSLTKNSLQVSMMWIMFWLLTGSLASLSQGLVAGLARGNPEVRERYEWTSLISYNTNLSQVRRELLGTQRAWDQFQEMRLGELQKILASAGRFGPGGRPPRFNGGPPAPLPPPGILAGVPTPVSWSAGVLGGLFLASIAILSTRIRGMDRLR